MRIRRAAYAGRSTPAHAAARVEGPPRSTKWAGLSHGCVSVLQPSRPAHRHRPRDPGAGSPSRSISDGTSLGSVCSSVCTAFPLVLRSVLLLYAPVGRSNGFDRDVTHIGCLDSHVPATCAHGDH